MYSNLHFNGHGEFKEDWYWSSSENSNNVAWRKKFVNDALGTDYKNEGLQVRAIRNF